MKNHLEEPFSSNNNIRDIIVEELNICYFISWEESTAVIS